MTYNTANVYGNADTTLVQVMRVVWQSVRIVCVPGVTTYHGAYHQTGARYHWTGLNQRLIAEAQIRKHVRLDPVCRRGGGGVVDGVDTAKNIPQLLNIIEI